MSPDEVLEELSLLNLHITRRTLLNYEKWSLIPQAIRGSFGRGKGRFAEYPSETVEQAYAAWNMLNSSLNRTRVSVVAKVRLSNITDAIDFRPASFHERNMISEWNKYILFARLRIPAGTVECYLNLGDTKTETISNSTFTDIIKEAVDGDIEAFKEDVYFAFITQTEDRIYIVKWYHDKAEAEYLWDGPKSFKSDR